jgi:sulfite reductase (ferredoxin)
MNMESFRTEIEDPIVQKEIVDLERKIALFKEGKIDDERFRSLRLARGVYGQRQEGVQMIRIKLPFGKVTSEQLERILRSLMNILRTFTYHYTPGYPNPLCKFR